jgi:LysR family glycine cleavage system transcriptional activator
MKNPLPPLNWLRAFEITARHMSVTRAAAELGVSPSAVSQQIKQLEDFLQVRLISRVGNRLILTDAGHESLPGFTEAFRQLGDTVTIARGVADSGPVNVSIAPSLAIKWLLPRLTRFYDQYPEVSLGIFTSMDVASFDRSGIDIAVRYGSGLYPGLYARKLMPEHVIPVCSPQLIARTGPLNIPSDLVNFTLLHEWPTEQDRTCPTWRTFLSSDDTIGIDPRRGPHFNQASMVVDAACAGLGVALAKKRIAKRDFESGYLTALFDTQFDVEFSYHLVCLPEKVRLGKVSKFIDWISEEAAQDS